jgi:anionic cell wall polymer biosynthesis LytR-Cps2A-Psr (LCP) family protein
MLNVFKCRDRNTLSKVSSFLATFVAVFDNDLLDDFFNALTTTIAAVNDDNVGLRTIDGSSDTSEEEVPDGSNAAVATNADEDTNNGANGVG